ncbi:MULTISPECIES: ScbR family autoregulator-binding transcription factor [unclassified Streptomyces]|jgi:AcrR family transcriptional regulator|uniref:ScbR family autoregulator-binding transcription factor n=1 Tax=unclassified Streptomyces TaxID=2593676 RepID=UPI0029A3F67B|nr:ScbR family autoregulator-binding transcription factor [Streptomyces sp. ME18-1-4]MDX3243363.1 ScbR family autoregulator-binding transcription factor [Streptomyces sp. ME18-1-4]
MMVKQARAVRTRQSLVRAAAEVFAAEGYARASLPAISERAGVSTGALHFHFSSKDDLAGAVERAAADAVEQLAQRCRNAADTRLQSLVHMASSLLLAVVTEPVIRAAFRLSGDPSRKNGAQMLRWWHGWVHDLIVQAQHEGELAQDVSADAAATVIVAATTGLEVLGAADCEWLSVERMTQLWTFVLPRLAASPDPAPFLAGIGAAVTEQRE